MARVNEQFYDATTNTQYREGDEYDGPDEKKERLREQGIVGESMTDRPQGEQFDYQNDYNDAQKLAGQLDLDIALNSSHEELIEAIEQAK